MGHIGQLTLELCAFECRNFSHAFVIGECNKHISKASWSILFKFTM